jgi:hypothetical protein
MLGSSHLFRKLDCSLFFDGMELRLKIRVIDRKPCNPQAKITPATEKKTTAAPAGLPVNVNGL